MEIKRELCGKIGDVIDSGALKNNFRLVGQMEGSSGSIMDNIAEGFERGTKLEFIQFLGYSKGSCGELRAQLYRAFDRKYISQEEFDDFCSLATRISAMIQKFIEYLQQTNIKGLRKKEP
ncbi:MAG: four helix bundle protein [Bacteroidota bacterium]